jgi:error-prone DNA polymerase
MKRSMARMKELEVKLRSGMTGRGLDAPTQDRIVQGISSFALYGFPESHAASFALIAYASAYFKVHYLAAFTCAMLNNQPMGFYAPAVLIKDAQRHGLRIRVIDVQRSNWQCALEREADGGLSLRVGLLYVKGLRRLTAEALVAAREEDGPYLSTADLALRVPGLNPREFKQLARAGVLNSLEGVQHRRDALWQVEQAGRAVGPLLRHPEAAPQEDSEESPLRQMTTEERLVADYSGTGVTVGRHPMAYRREELRRRNILSARDLQEHCDGSYVRAAGCVIARQRPGTAKGFIFLSLEDETGIMNVIIGPELYERERVLITRGKFLLVQGKLQNQDTVVHVRADRVLRLPVSDAPIASHDFH